MSVLMLQNDCGEWAVTGTRAQQLTSGLSCVSFFSLTALGQLVDIIIQLQRDLAMGESESKPRLKQKNKTTLKNQPKSK